jgi:NitT/TauT family transport system substrate-binding protein
MRSTTSRTLVLLAAILLALTATACGGDDDSSSASGATGSSGGDAPDSITIAGPEASRLSPTYSGWQIAEASGAFDEIAEDFGTEFGFQGTGANADAVTALLGGQADIAVVNAGDVLAAAAEGRDVVYTPALNVGTTVTLMGSTSNEDERGTDLSAYEGGTLGYVTEGSSGAIYSKLLLDEEGIDYDGVALGHTSALLPALEGGRIDLATVDFGSTARAINDDIAYIVAGPDDYPPEVTGALGGGFVYTAEFAARYPDLVDSITAALIDGSVTAGEAEAPADALALFPQEFQDTYSEAAVWEQLWELTQVNHEPGEFDGGFTQERLDATLALAVTSGRITQEQADELEPDLGQMFDDSRIDRAYETLGISRPATR